MADPVTLGTIAVGATAAGGVTKMFGNLFTGEAQASADNYRAAIAQMNARIATQDAQYAVASGEVEAQQVGLRAGEQIARTRTAFAAGNLDVASGSPSKIISSELAVGQQSEGITRANAAKRAYGFEVASAEDTAQGTLYQMAAANDRTSGYINATSSFLGTVGSVASQGIGGSKAGSGIFSG